MVWLFPSHPSETARCLSTDLYAPSKLARTSSQGGGLDLSLTARIDRARPFDL